MTKVVRSIKAEINEQLSRRAFFVRHAQRARFTIVLTHEDGNAQRVPRSSRGLGWVVTAP